MCRSNHLLPGSFLVCAGTDTQLVASNIKDLSAELVELRKKEQDISSQLFALQKNMGKEETKKKRLFWLKRSV